MWDLYAVSLIFLTLISIAGRCQRCRRFIGRTSLDRSGPLSHMVVVFFFFYRYGNQRREQRWGPFHPSPSWHYSRSLINAHPPSRVRPRYRVRSPWGAALGGAVGRAFILEGIWEWRKVIISLERWPEEAEREGRDGMENDICFQGAFHHPQCGSSCFQR